MSKTLNFSLILIFLSTASYAETINNNISTGSSQPVYTCPPANQNNIYDPRIPPAGVYHTQSGTVYTTGEKKPYITDNNCNSGGGYQPYVYATPPGAGPAPGPTPGPRPGPGR